ncbi:hypothetical protein BDV40DRAFT_281018 [Aspergillus tamarii]|uniref:Uncharacterized protein n=1 Tax=Aspergillus tamarii TaxID=41984 RepID=A0A5N6UD13_ASPTM|nr:hypothetical protein BDV40DRAFT_281018 [Aspergillus tamarii]
MDQYLLPLTHPSIVSSNRSAFCHIMFHMHTLRRFCLAVLIRCFSKGESGRQPDDLTSFSGEMPHFETEIDSTTYVQYFGTDNYVIENKTVTKTYRINHQEVCTSNREVEEVKEPESDDVSDKSTLVGISDIEARRSIRFSEDGHSMGPEEASDDIPYGPYPDERTGRLIIELLKVSASCPNDYEVSTILLDDCEGKARVSALDGDDVEALLHYGDYNFWRYVPRDYAVQRGWI